MRNVEDLRFHVMGKEKMDQATAIGTRSQRTSRKRRASTTKNFFLEEECMTPSRTPSGRLKKRCFAETQDSRQAH